MFAVELDYELIVADVEFSAVLYEFVGKGSDIFIMSIGLNDIPVS